MTRLHGLKSALALMGLLLLGLPRAAHAQDNWYDVEYHARFVPAAGSADVSIVVRPGGGRPTCLDFAMDERRYTNVTGDGELTRSDGRTTWLPPESGGTLRYRYQIDHRRNAKGYDARITDRWAILRGDDLFAHARVRSTKGARARATLRFELPEHWSEVDTQYLHDDVRGLFVVDNPERRFVRPTGWIIAGHLEVQREHIGNLAISIATPRGLVYPRLDIIRFIRAAAPELRRLGGLPPKLLIVGAGDPMWRGGLSATRSLWMHADLPVMSSDSSSTLIHELVHVVTRIRGTRGDDWIAEGIAEYYAIELPYRLGIIRDQHRNLALQRMQHRGQTIQTLRAISAAGARTARAVALFADLDRAIRERSLNTRSLDDVVRRLGAKHGRTSLSDLQRAVELVQGDPSPLLDEPLVR